MPYYPTLRQDVARAKQILAEGRASAETLDGIDAPVIISMEGGTIFGKDIYAAYKLLESFVEVIETMDVKVCELAMRARKRGEELTRESITCPRCAMTSYNANDIRERYCGNCHQFHDEMVI